MGANMEITAELKKILHNNTVLLLERKHTRAILCDVYKNEMSKVNTLMAAYDEGIIDSLRESTSMDNKEKTRFIKILTNQHAMQENIAKSAVETWCNIIDASVIFALIKAEEAQKSDEVVADILIRESQIKHSPEIGETKPNSGNTTLIKNAPKR